VDISFTELKFQQKLITKETYESEEKMERWPTHLMHTILEVIFNKHPSYCYLS